MKSNIGFGLRRARIAASAVIIVGYFLQFAGRGVVAYFGTDDLMNMYWSMDHSFAGLLRDNLTFWSGSYRPLGAIFYRTTYALAGFHPLAFHLGCFALLLLNLYLVYKLAIAVTHASETALLAALIFAYHPNFAELYFNAGTIYDILCFTFYCLALLVYIRGGRPALFYACFILALNAKEMAATMPLVILAYDAVYRKRIRYAWIVPTSLISAAFCAGKLLLKSPFSGHPAYTPLLTAGRYLDNTSHYLGDLFYHRAWFTPETTILIHLCLIAVAFLLRQKAMQFASIFLWLAPLPVVFISTRGGYVMYLAMAAWAIYIAALITATRRQFSTRVTLAPQFAIFLLCAILLIKVHSSGRRHVDVSIIGSHQILRSTAAQFFSANPTLPRGASILCRNDPFPNGDFVMLFLIRLKYADRSLKIDRPGNYPPEWRPNLPDYNLIFDFQQPIQGKVF